MKQYPFLIPLLVMLTCALLSACAATWRTPAPVPPGPKPKPQPRLASEYIEQGRLYLRQKDYYEAIRNFKLAHYLDPGSQEAAKYLKEAESAYSEVCRGISRAERCTIELEVGRKFMQLGMYAHAREAFRQGTEIIRWFPYSFAGMERYEDLFKSAIEECDRKLSHQNSSPGK